MHTFVRIFLGIWFTGLLAVEFRLASTSTNSANLLLPAAFAFFGLLLVYWGKKLSVNDEADIAKYLRNILGLRS